MEMTTFPTKIYPMRKKQIIIGFLLALVCIIVGLIIAKPDMNDFHEYISAKILEAMMSDNDPEFKAVSEEFNKLLQSSLPLMTDETSLGVCSIFSLKMPSRSYSYLGIGGRYIPLQSETFNPSEE